MRGREFQRHVCLWFGYEINTTGVQQYIYICGTESCISLSVLCNWIALVNVEVSTERLWSSRMICVVLVPDMRELYTVSKKALAVIFAINSLNVNRF